MADFMIANIYVQVAFWSVDRSVTMVPRECYLCVGQTEVCNSHKTLGDLRHFP